MLSPKPFPNQQHDRLDVIAEPGDVLCTASKVRARDWLNPKDALEKKWAGRGIRAYNERKGYLFRELTHVRLVASKTRLFEFTTPVATFTDITAMRDKYIVVCRPQFELDPEVMLSMCRIMDGSPYDYFELGAFLLREYGKVGEALADLLDREKRWVCSSGVGKILHMSSHQRFMDDWETYAPAKYPEKNVPFKFRIISKAVI